MKSKVYLETTVVSYLVARRTLDIIQAAHQELTRRWWSRRERFDLFVSRPVLSEAARGDAEAAGRRLEALKGIPVLTLSRPATAFAQTLVRSRTLPPNARIDALHVAIAVVHGMDYLLTWNCRHIANASIRGKIEAACRDAGMHPPIICTPEELLEA